MATFSPPAAPAPQPAYDQNTTNQYRSSSQDSDQTLLPPSNTTNDPTMSTAFTPVSLSDATANTNTNAMPRITYNLRNHKKGIIITWSILLLTSLILPILLYLVLKRAANVSITVVLAVPTAIFGAPSLFSLGKRTWLLCRKDSDCRPLGSRSRWHMDFFNWNFLINFIVITVIISVGNAVENPRVCALGLPVLVTAVGVELLIAIACEMFGVRAPLRISSVAKGERIRGGVYTIAEDICAVDSHGRVRFRQELARRWEASKEVRRLVVVLDLFWGISGVAVGGVCIGLMFGSVGEDAAWCIGWGGPWALAILGGLLTLGVCKFFLGREREHLSMPGEVEMKA